MSPPTPKKFLIKISGSGARPYFTINSFLKTFLWAPEHEKSTSIFIEVLYFFVLFLQLECIT